MSWLVRVCGIDLWLAHRQKNLLLRYKLNIITGFLKLNPKNYQASLFDVSAISETSCSGVFKILLSCLRINKSVSVFFISSRKKVESIFGEKKAFRTKAGAIFAEKFPTRCFLHFFAKKVFYFSFLTKKVMTRRRSAATLSDKDRKLAPFAPAIHSPGL